MAPIPMNGDLGTMAVFGGLEWQSSGRRQQGRPIVESWRDFYFIFRATAREHSSLTWMASVLDYWALVTTEVTLTGVQWRSSNTPTTTYCRKGPGEKVIRVNAPWIVQSYWINWIAMKGLSNVIRFATSYILLKSLRRHRTLMVYTRSHDWKWAMAAQ